MSVNMKDLTSYVSLRWGVDNEGNTVIGPQRPNASINPGPDTEGGGHSGYFSNHAIRGFSQIHASGTGWGKYGQFLISPQIGLDTGFEEHDSPAEDEVVTCCDYRVFLKRYGISCHITPSEHSALYSFVYPRSDNASILIDLAHSIPLLAGLVNTASGISASHLALDIKTDMPQVVIMYGSGIYAGGFGRAHALYFYMCINKKPSFWGCYDGGGQYGRQTHIERDRLKDKKESLGGFIRFTTNEHETIKVKIAVSFTNCEKAKQWLDTEIPDWDEESIYKESKELWNQELNKIQIGDSVSETEKTILYTAVYHSMCMPRDRTGDIPGFQNDEPMIDDHYAVWDTWRTLYPLYILIKPEMVTKTINSFISRYQKNGYVRDTFVGGVDMFQEQGGNDVDNVICDAYVKDVKGIDWKKAYAVVKNHADNYRLGWYSENKPEPNPSGPYYRFGFLPDDIPLPDTPFSQMACSYTLEHAYNDYCAAVMAKELGVEEDYALYLKRSENWNNLWNPNVAYGPFRGFICPRNSDGTWIDYNPGEMCGSWVRHFYEATGYNYSFFVPQNVPELIARCGGEEAFIHRLLYGIHSGLVDYGNEPAFLSCYLFAYTHKPWLTTECVERLRGQFTLQGPPGNDDSGAMSSWYIFSSLGFFPNAGQNMYFLTSPSFDTATMILGKDKSLEIHAKNLSKTNKYIQTVSINGQRWKKTMFPHEMIENGGVIEFEMGSTPTNYTK